MQEPDHALCSRRVDRDAAGGSIPGELAGDGPRDQFLGVPVLADVLYDGLARLRNETVADLANERCGNGRGLAILVETEDALVVVERLGHKVRLADVLPVPHGGHGRELQNLRRIAEHVERARPEAVPPVGAEVSEFEQAVPALEQPVGRHEAGAFERVLVRQARVPLADRHRQTQHLLPRFLDHQVAPPEVDQRVLLRLYGLDHRLVVEQGRGDPPLQITLALRVIPVPVPVDVVEPRLAEHVDTGRELVGLPVRRTDRDLHARIAHRGDAIGPVLVLHLQVKPHLVLAPDSLFRVRLEIAAEELRAVQQVNPLSRSKPFPFSQRRLPIDSPSLLQSAIVAILLSQPVGEFLG